MFGWISQNVLDKTISRGPDDPYGYVQTSPRWSTVPPGWCELCMTPFDWAPGPELPPPPFSPTEKEAGEGGERKKKKTASLSCEWWVAAMGDILPSLFLSPLSHCFHCLSLSFFLLHCLDTFLSLSHFIHLSLHPSTPQVISLSLLCCFASSFSTPSSPLFPHPRRPPWFFFVCCHSFSLLFFSPLYAPPLTHTHTTHTHTHTIVPHSVLSSSLAPVM